MENAPPTCHLIKHQTLRNIEKKLKLSYGNAFTKAHMYFVVLVVTPDLKLMNNQDISLIIVDPTSNDQFNS